MNLSDILSIIQIIIGIIGLILGGKIFKSIKILNDSNQTSNGNNNENFINKGKMEKSALKGNVNV